MDFFAIVGLLSEKGTIGLIAGLCVLFAMKKDREAEAAKRELIEAKTQLVEGYRRLALDISETIKLNVEETSRDDKEKRALDGSNRNLLGPAKPVDRGAIHAESKASTSDQ